MQLSQKCPEGCIHIGKLNNKGINDKVSELLVRGVEIRNESPDKAIDIFDKALEINKSNWQCLIEKSIALGKLNKFEEEIDCLKSAASIFDDDNIHYRIALAYRKANRFNDSIDSILKCKGKINNTETEYLLGDCYFMTGQFEKAIECMEKVIVSESKNREIINNAKITLSKIYLSFRNIDKMMEIAENIDDNFKEEKMILIQNGYFASGRMYELLKLINEIDNFGPGEKFMLLQCALVLKKNNQGNIINIIDDLLKNGYYSGNSFEETRLLGLKVRLLFKELKMRQAYEIFYEYSDRIISGAKDIYDCYESCHLIAFFLYNLEKNRSILIYKTITGMAIDEFIIDELYNAFTTMDITPYIRAKAIEKSLDLMKSGKSENFNRTVIVADLLYEYGEFSQAFDLYRRIDSEKPDAIILYKMAVCLMKQNKFEEAQEMFLNVSALSKFIPGVYPGIIKCCLETNNEWSEFYKSVELEKLSFSEIYELAGNLMSKEIYDKSGYLFSYILEKYKNIDMYSKKTIYHNMVCVYRNLNEHSKGIELINEVCENYFGLDLLVDLGCLYYDLGEYDKSKDMFDKALDKHDNFIVNFNLGVLSIKLKEYQKALSYFNLSIMRIMEEVRRKNIYFSKEYGNMLVKLYSNSGLCLLKLGKLGEALIMVDKSSNIDRNHKVAEIISVIQRKILDTEKGIENEDINIDQMLDNCVTIKEGFTEDIRRLLDEILVKIYGKYEKRIRINDSIVDSISGFIKNEKRIYTKYKESIERSEGTFQRYVDNLVSSFDRKVIVEAWKEAAVTSDNVDTIPDITLYAKQLMDFGDELFRNFEYSQTEEYIYSSLIPYYRIIKQLSMDIVYPYYNKYRDLLPAPVEPQDFKDIGIYSYKAGGETCYRIDFSFDISCSEYLFEINCHPGLRSAYINYIKHYMPWDKLLWMISGIKKKWDIIDDAKSVGLLLLFYCGYKNYLCVEGDFSGKEEIIKLAGDLIQINNERDHYIRCMLNGDFEFDYLSSAKNVREIAKRCIEGLLKIKRIVKE